jgi:hypothetical protein
MTPPLPLLIPAKFKLRMKKKAVPDVEARFLKQKK